MRREISFILTAVLLSVFVSSAVAQKSKSMLPKQPANSVKSTSFANIAAYSDGKSSWLTWTMEAEVGNIGFNVYRVSNQGVELLTPVKMVAGAALRAREIPQYGETYNFYDEFGANSAYYVESLSLRGTTVTTERIYPRYVPSLTGFTGLSLEEMKVRGGVYRPTEIQSNVPSYTKDIIAEMEEYRQFADDSVHRMVISQPGVVRIGVKRDGLYRVTRAQLEAALFDVSSDPTTWKLFVEGVEQAIIVGENAGYIEFYGRALDTPETDIRRYYLMSSAGAGKRIQTRVAPPTASTVTTPSYLQTFVKKERTQYVEDIFNGELENYFGRGVNSNAALPAMTFNLSGVDFARPDATMQLRFQGYSAGDHVIEVILNGETLAPATGSNLSNFTADYAIPTAFLREGANSIKFRAIGPTGDFVFFDTIKIGFYRKYVADQNKIDFFTQNYRIAKLDGFTSANFRVFDMTHDGSPVLMTNLQIQQIGSTFGASIPAARGRSFFAIEDSAILAPESVTPNNPELLSVPTNAANLIIISYKDFMTQAEAWAQYRRNQGFTVKVIEVSELYDEFNYGALSAKSIKDFLQYAYQQWATPPQYVMLIGDASWDSRNYENVGAFNLIPAKMVTTVYLETASDEALADFNNDGLAEIAIGRIPARTVANVTTVFTKTVNWESALTPTSLSRGFLFAHDFNQGYNFAQMNELLRDQLPAGTPSTMVFRGDVNANTTLLNEMGMGKFMVNYSGHGTAGSWGGNPLFFNVFSVPLQIEHQPAIYTMLTCLNGYYHWLYNPSMAEVLVNTPSKGAVAAWGSSGLTTPNVQEEMARQFYLKTGDGTIPRLGDLVRDAKTALTGQFESPDVRLSWALIGDPMLKVR
jgi:hypothetical protein